MAVDRRRSVLVGALLGISLMAAVDVIVFLLVAVFAGWYRKAPRLQAARRSLAPAR